MKLIVPALSLFLAALPTPEPPLLAEGTDLAARIAAISREAKGVVGVSIIGIEGGPGVQTTTARFPMASTYKLPIALAVLDAADAGKLRLDERIEVKRTDLIEGGTETILHAWKPGAAYTVRELLDLMVIESDNIAADVLFARVGGPGAVKAFLDARKIADIDVSRTERQLAADFTGVSLPAKAVTREEYAALRKKVPAAAKAKARARFEADKRDTATPQAMALLLARLQKGELLGKESTTVALDMLRRCKTGAHRIRALLPPGTVVGNKTGTAGRTTNDVGLVTLPGGGHFAIAVFVKDSDAPVEVRERTIAKLARAAYDEYAATQATRVR